MDPVPETIDEADATSGGIALRSSEIALGWMRVGAFAFGAVQTTIFPWSDFPHHPTQAPLASYALTAAIGIAGVATLLLVPRTPDVRRLAHVGFAVDAAVIVGFTLVYAFEVGGSTNLLMLLIPVEAALKFSLRGALLSTTVVAAGEVANQVLGDAFWGIDAEWNHATFLIGLALLIGGITGVLSRSAERRRAEAIHEAARARELAVLAESSRRDLATVHRVILVGIGARPDEALEEMAREVRRRLGYDHIAVMLRDGEGEPYVACSEGGSAELRERIRPDPGGPVERVLAGEPAQFVTGTALTQLSHVVPDIAAEAVAPIRVRGTVIGALIAEVSAENTLRIEDLPLLQQLADQMGLVIEAARAYEREQELALRYRELDRMKTDFIAIASHELRTPLTAIVGFTETLARDGLRLNAGQRQRIDEAITRQAHRLHRLVSDLQTVGSIDAGTLDIQLAEIAVGDVVDVAMESVSPTGGITVDGDHSVTVRADFDRLVQVVTNLLTNAIAHGAPPIDVTWEVDEATVRISVADAGPGIPPDQRASVFKRFVKGGDVLSHQRGSGLGLAIARELVEAMGGDLALDEERTDGTRITATLQRALARVSS